MIYYVSPSGNDNNAGTEVAPFRNLQKLSNKMVAGDTAFVRGGTYTPTTSTSMYIHMLIINLNGTAANPIKIENYPGEKPVFDFTGFTITTNDTWAMYVDTCSHLHIKGLRITGLAQNRNGIGVSRGMAIANSNNIKVELCEIDHMGGSGFFTGHSDDVYYLNCDAHHLADPYSTTSDPYGGADGFGGTGGETSKRTVYEGCRAWWCSDDGFDFFLTDGLRTMINCWSFWNGYIPGTFTPGGNGEGYKLGPTATNQSANVTKILTNCLAFENLNNGFSQNTAQSKFRFYNNTSYKNGRSGYWFGWYSNIIQDFKNNIGFDNPGGNMDDNGQAQGSTNSWNGSVTLTAADFASLSSVGVDGPRQPDGSLPNLPFLKLVVGSDLIDSGQVVGLPYSGIAPDMGAFESGLIIPPPPQACTYTYSAWGACVNGVQTRTVVSSTPANCVGTPVLTQTCTVVNTPPIVNAGADETFVISKQITGSATDNEAVVSYKWTKISGPTGLQIVTPNAATTVLKNLKVGTYVLRLTATDNNGLKSFDDKILTIQ